MEIDDLNLGWQENQSSIIKVVGVGGGGGNAVTYMCEQGIHNVDFIICNTDAQALAKSPVPTKIQLGKGRSNEGLGAGGKPEVGREAAINSEDEIREALNTGTKMVFVTAGMGGGTGTGAAPVIARIAKEMGILTVAIVTIPFRFEGTPRFDQAIDGINELKNHVDSLLIINNEKLREIYGNLRTSQAFSKADDVLTMAAKGIAELITLPGTVNVDFADVSTIMSNGGITVMGSAKAVGENRARKAVEAALNSPLLNNSEITGAGRILLNITSGTDDNEVTMDELSEITDYVTQSTRNSLMIWGTGNDASLGEAVSVTIVATNFPKNCFPELKLKDKAVIKVPMNPPRGGYAGTDDFPVQEPDEVNRPQTQTSYFVRDKTPMQAEITWEMPATATDIAEKPRIIPIIVGENADIDEL
jgi:cell division protein FtsZ